MEQSREIEIYGVKYKYKTPVTITAALICRYDNVYFPGNTALQGDYLVVNRYYVRPGGMDADFLALHLIPHANPQIKRTVVIHKDAHVALSKYRSDFTDQLSM